MTADPRDMVEIVARLGATIVDVACLPTETRYRLGTTELVAAPGIHRVGLVDVTMTHTARPRRLARAVGEDRRTLPYLAMSLALHVGLCTLAMATPLPIGGALVPTAADRPATVVGWRVGPPGAATLAPRETAPITSKRAPRRARARNRAVGSGQPVSLADLAGLAGSIAAPSIDLAAGFAGDRVGDAAGGGFGDSRSGGGDGDGDGLMGDARYGTRADSGAQWPGAARGGSRERASGVPTVILCGGPAPCVATGDLDKAIIRRYIRRELAKIRYCYEKQLLADDRLAGAVSTDFVIDADGKVVEATGRGMDEAVARCVADVIRTIEFPRSATRSSTRVAYPFVFRRSGS